MLKNSYSIVSKGDKKINDYIQFVSIDPGTINFGFRIERRYVNIDKIKTICFIKQKLKNVGDDEYIAWINTIKFLNSYITQIKKSHYILVEKQLKRNYNMTRMGQHIISYFLTTLITNTEKPTIVEVNSKIKTGVLGAPKKMNKTQRKNWCVDKAIDLLKKRKDFYGLKSFEDRGKKDEFGDTVCQIEAFCILCKLPITN